MNENQKEQYKQAVTSRMLSVRLRAWSLTVAIIVSLVMYFLVGFALKEKLDIIDFVLLCIVQILIHIIYFDEGDIYGQKDSAFISNRQSYNEKATKISQGNLQERLRDYCKYEFELRKKFYIRNECAIIGITEEIFEKMQLSAKEEEIKKMTEVVIGVDEKTGENKTMHLSRYRRKRLYRLLFKRIPVEPNQPETIMSAIESDGTSAIHDGSIRYKNNSYIRKFLMAVVVGGIFAYIVPQLQNGITFGTIAKLAMYLTSIFSTLVTAFTAGENKSRIYKNQFYIRLSNFMDGFNEWNTRTGA